MNQTEFLALMRSDLVAAGIDPKEYISQDMTLSILVGYKGKYKEPLAQGFVKCPYFKELALRLSYYLAETAMRPGRPWGPWSVGGVFEERVNCQAEYYGVPGEEFIEWLFSRESADRFMFHLTWDDPGMIHS